VQHCCPISHNFILTQPRVPDVETLEPEPFRVLPTIRLNGSLGQQYSEMLSESVERKFHIKEKTIAGTEHENETKITIGLKQVCPLSVIRKASDTVSNEVS
jgi:hypothetical protein